MLAAQDGCVGWPGVRDGVACRDFEQGLFLKGLHGSIVSLVPMASNLAEVLYRLAKENEPVLVMRFWQQRERRFFVGLQVEVV